MGLGDAFSVEMKEAFARRCRLPGAVIRCPQVMDDRKVHEKRFVVLHVDDETLTIVINSELNEFVERTPALRQCQVAMPKADHPFMRWDSFVDCSKIRKYRTQDLVNHLASNTTDAIGTITPELRDQIVSALKHSVTNLPADVKICADALNQAQLGA